MATPRKAAPVKKAPAKPLTEKAEAQRLARQRRREEPKLRVQLLAGLSGTGKYMQIVELNETRAWFYVDTGWARWPEDAPVPKRAGRDIPADKMPRRRTEVVEVFDPNMAPGSVDE